VWFEEKLSFNEHIQAKINKAYMMLGTIKRNFKHLTVPTFGQRYTSMVRSHLDYCSSVWAPYKKRYIGSGKGTEKSYKNSTDIETAALQ